MIITHSTFSLLSFVSHYLFPDLHSTFYSFPTYWYPLPIWYLPHIIHIFHWWFDHSSFLSFRYRHSLWLLLSPWLMRFFYALHLIHEGTGLIIGYLSLVSFHFFHPITLAYVTSRVLRPPWGHEIRRYLWQSSLGQVFGRLVEVWSLLCSLLWKILLEAFGFSLAWHINVWWIFEFGDISLMISDSSFCRASDIHTGAYFLIFFEYPLD